MGAAYDLFGNGKTSLKVNISKYLETAQNGGLYTSNNPAVTFQQTTTRSWTDGNRNFIPDCDLMNPAAQNNLASGGDNCGAWNNLNFGNPFVTTRVNPDVQHGWGVRQLRLAVRRRRAARDPAARGDRRQLQPPLVGQLLRHRQPRAGPADFDQVTITAPQNAKLPDGGGHPVTFLTRNARTALGATDNYFTSAERLRRRDGLLARRRRADERAGWRVSCSCSSARAAAAACATTATSRRSCRSCT